MCIGGGKQALPEPLACARSYKHLRPAKAELRLANRESVIDQPRSLAKQCPFLEGETAVPLPEVIDRGAKEFEDIFERLEVGTEHVVARLGVELLVAEDVDVNLSSGRKVWQQVVRMSFSVAREISG
jgi:hypothetical protein